MVLEVTHEDRSTAPFNMALKTLEKIHNILIQIALVSVIPTPTDMNYNLALGKAQHAKYALVRQLYIQSIPLFDKKQTAEWKIEMNQGIRDLKKDLITASVYNNGKIIGMEERYSHEMDEILDDVTIEIEETLQDEGYFMPPKDDVRFSWKQE